MERFTEFKASIENDFERKIKSLRSNNGGEYIKSELVQIFSDSGIQIQHSIPYTPEQTRVAERKNQALKEMTTCMLEAKGLDDKLWAEDMNVAAHIKNRVPHSSMKGKTPSKAYFGHKSDVSNFKVFGSTAWARIPHDKRKDLKPKKVLNVC